MVTYVFFMCKAKQNVYFLFCFYCIYCILRHKCFSTGEDHLLFNPPPPDSAFVPTLECNAPNGEQHLWIWAWTQSKREMKDERLRKGNILRCSRHFWSSYYVVFKFSSENLLPSGWVVIRIPAVTRRTILSLRSAVYRAGNQKWHFLRVTVCIMYLGCVFVDMIWKI